MGNLQIDFDRFIDVEEEFPLDVAFQQAELRHLSVIGKGRLHLMDHIDRLASVGLIFLLPCNCHIAFRCAEIGRQQVVRLRETLDDAAIGAQRQPVHRVGLHLPGKFQQVLPLALAVFQLLIHRQRFLVAGIFLEKFAGDNLDLRQVRRFPGFLAQGFQHRFDLGIVFQPEGQDLADHVAVAFRLFADIFEIIFQSRFVVQQIAVKITDGFQQVDFIRILLVGFQIDIRGFLIQAVARHLVGHQCVNAHIAGVGLQQAVPYFQGLLFLILLKKHIAVIHIIGGIARLGVLLLFDQLLGPAGEGNLQVGLQQGLVISHIADIAAVERFEDADGVLMLVAPLVALGLAELTLLQVADLRLGLGFLLGE